jgi:hypothetical protein
VNVDARQVTLAGPAPGLGVAVVLPRYEEYRLCRFAPAVDWMHGDVSWFESEVEIREVFRAL